jgi:ABC-type Fe3+-hydroxamate transport system substrate-binding protein
MPTKTFFDNDNDRTPGGNGCIDAAGVRHPPAGEDARIVSLVPSITELLFDLGLDAAVVGRTVFCVHPKDRVRAARSVGGTKQINFEKLRSLAPTHVIVNVDETPLDLANAIAALGCRVVVTHPVDVTDNLTLFRLIGGLFGRATEADALASRLQAALAAVEDATARWPPRRVLYLIWKNPWMTVSRDTYIARMLAQVNWQTVADDPAIRYPTIRLTTDLLAETDLVLFSSEPFPFSQTHVEDFCRAFPEHAAKALTIDGQMVSWYGSRAIAGIAYLHALAKKTMTAKS